MSSCVSSVPLPRCSLLAQQDPNQSPRLAYQEFPDVSLPAFRTFLRLPSNMHVGEVSRVTVNSKGHISAFNRGQHPLLELITMETRSRRSASGSDHRQKARNLSTRQPGALGDRLPE